MGLGRQSAVDHLGANTENVIAADVLIGALEDPGEGVRFQAAQAFQRMPKDMVVRAKAALQKLSSARMNLRK
jgi:hypothetical protein